MIRFCIITVSFESAVMHSLKVVLQVVLFSVILNNHLKNKGKCVPSGALYPR
ncbi:hypothetical protein O7U_00427 [Bartonella quintana JK 68]|uniref:Uncharacterized protein n=1 Tax=Bartonella quintana JK 68 TaxID=1134503 RepID=A0ABR4SQW5_BARQI|nr:hypothetical protein Q651_00086 [Bartonella quintana BQ2-D70]KEC59881.1 hypothetical protein O93_00427 [Bartonella quintana JK 19]KEC62798.1 hypothetical protein O7Y_00835 [Bartonella quintana JK 63]KEC63344.1 hypothetical protein O91_00079 [Bartonella quintana JK 31]KEC64193.1 hypothetical protein O7W_01047 [Bartonella quintana JK 56]KEC66676.1 hypothetical protein O7U_00427 [Bartonella quintana JK 68]KEC67506.1 hypothetical protein O7S_00406 [Bartonella quintana JK 67]KEC68322.1 hypothe